MDGIAQLAFKPVVIEFFIRLYVPNSRFYRTVAFDLGSQATDDASSDLNAVSRPILQWHFCSLGPPPLYVYVCG